MNFLEVNEKERNYYKKDFSCINELTLKIREALITGKTINIDDLDYSDIIDWNFSGQAFYITIFQPMRTKIRVGTRRSDLRQTINQAVQKLRENPRFEEFDIKNPEKTRILIEWTREREEINIKELHAAGEFDKNRFEPGITGIEIQYKGFPAIWLPTDCVSNSITSLNSVLLRLANRLELGNKNTTSTEKIELLKNLEGARYYLFKSRAFITHKTETIPLYRGNVLYKDFSYKTLYDMTDASNRWIVKFMKDDNRFLYHYNPVPDDYIDPEYPKRRPPDLYYNELRHCGGVISLLEAYEITGDKSYLTPIKRGIDYIVYKATKFHKDDKGREAAYVVDEGRIKLGGAGLALIMLILNHDYCKDKNYDRYAEAYTRHLLSRITDNGEFLNYYTIPNFNGGKPIKDMTFEQRKKTYTFFYPGEALLGLALFANRYDKNEELKKEVIQKCKKALHWLVVERPKYYDDLFTKLPQDAWLMQAINEWADCKGFVEKCDIDFVIKDARTMISMMYKKDETPYLDYAGGFWTNNFGNYYHLSGARCEGLLAAYYLAKKFDMEKEAEEILAACKIAALGHMQQYISEYNNFAHRNPEKSFNSIKFHSVNQSVRVDTVQHTACFYARLYRAENNPSENNIVK